MAQMKQHGQFLKGEFNAKYSQRNKTLISFFSGGSAMDAIEQGCNYCELNPQDCGYSGASQNFTSL
jgi:hypothetical protein